MGPFPENKTELEVIEKRVIRRVTFRNFVSNVLDAFNITRGGIYSLKMILINPGQLARDYLGESRYKISSPFKMLILSTAIALLIINSLHLFDGFLNDSLTVNSDSQDQLKEKTIQIFISYFNLILWMYIPISAFFSFLFNKKDGFNYAENLVFQTFILTLTNIVAIVCFPIGYLTPNVAIWVAQIIMLAYMVYAYKVFFKKKWLRSFIENLVVFLIGSFVWTIVLIVFLVGVAAVVAK